MVPVVTYTKCGIRLRPSPAWNTPRFVPCHACEQRVRIEVYPALFRRIEAGRAAQPLLVEDEASCYYHPAKMAAVPCDGCGRFLCTLCDVEMDGRHLCPVCLETGKQKGRLVTLENRRVAYDNVALGLALLTPLFMWFLTPVTAPLVIYVAIRYWKAPASLIRRTKTRFVIALVFASLQIAGWLTLLSVALFT